MENVALVKRKQKSFNSRVKNYKDLLKKGDIKIVETVEKVPTPKKKQVAKKKGILYLGHIPHGFYEKQMMDYFKQFGRVTNLRLHRSKKSGKSKGHAFIEFEVPEVAKIAAESMNGYLMNKRVLKAQYISPEEQHKKYFKGKNYTEHKYPTKLSRRVQIKKINCGKNEQVESAAALRMMMQVNKVKKQLKNIGINYEFEPIDIPENLQQHFTSKVSSNVEDAAEEENVDVFEEEYDTDSEKISLLPSSKKQKITRGTKAFKKKSNVQNGNQENKVKKLTGISKKASKKPKVLVKENKKLKLMQNEILNSDQVKITKAKDIKVQSKVKKTRNKTTKN